MGRFEGSFPGLYEEIGALNTGKRIFIGGELKTFDNTRTLKIGFGFVDFIFNDARDTDIVFQVDFQRDNGIEMNNKFNGTWQTPVTSRSFPIKNKKPFCVEIIVESKKFQVKVDNENVADFEFRKVNKDVKDYQLLTVKADGVLTDVSWN